MLRRRTVHKDMADVNVYTAKRLKDMADSLEGLAKTFTKQRHPWCAEAVKTVGSQRKNITFIIYSGPLKRRDILILKICPGDFWRHAEDGPIIWDN